MFLIKFSYKTVRIQLDFFYVNSYLYVIKKKIGTIKSFVLKIYSDNNEKHMPPPFNNTFIT